MKVVFFHSSQYSTGEQWQIKSQKVQEQLSDSCPAIILSCCYVRVSSRLSFLGSVSSVCVMGVISLDWVWIVVLMLYSSTQVHIYMHTYLFDKFICMHIYLSGKLMHTHIVAQPYTHAHPITHQYAKPNPHRWMWKYTFVLLLYACVCIHDFGAYTCEHCHAHMYMMYICIYLYTCIQGLNLLFLSLF